MKSSSGTSMITVAIIVIIILLLLAVGLLVFLGEKGVFSTTRAEFAEKNVKSEEKILESIVQGAIDGDTNKVDYGRIDIPSDWTIISKGKYTSPTGNEFEVCENGEIIYKIMKTEENE